MQTLSREKVKEIYLACVQRYGEGAVAHQGARTEVHAALQELNPFTTSGRPLVQAAIQKAEGEELWAEADRLIAEMGRP